MFGLRAGSVSDRSLTFPALRGGPPIGGGAGGAECRMIQVDNVTKVYRRGRVDVPVLRGLSCEIADRAFAFIVGPSGSCASAVTMSSVVVAGAPFGTGTPNFSKSALA